MSLERKNGILKTFKGDTIQITFNINGLEPIALYSFYLSLNFEKPVIKKIEANTNDDGFYKAIFEVACTETEVPPKKYTYGVKACRKGRENTIYTGIIEVQEKYVEGD